MITSFLKKDKVQDNSINQLKLEVHDTHKKDENITRNFEPTDDSDVINKAYIDKKFLQIDGHKSFLEKEYSEFELQYNKQSAEEDLIQQAVETIIQIFFDKSIFDSFPMQIKY